MITPARGAPKIAKIVDGLRNALEFIVAVKRPVGINR
jgi:hypothetical protein